MNRLSLSLVSVIFISIFLLFFACGKTKMTTKLQSVTATKSGAIFLKGPAATKDESYSHIVSNVARLKAMLTGAFVQYNTNADTAGKIYSTWLVNDGKDSIMWYQIPVGDYQKVGHWMYQYQIMTSLPDDPIHETFSKLVELSRDSIEESYFNPPSDFNVPLEELLADPEAAFAKVNLKELKPSATPYKICYVRQTPLHFAGESVFLPDDHPQNKDGLKIDYYHAIPEKVIFGIRHYTKEKVSVGESPPEQFFKISMMKSDAPK